jgi:hypothetical protein
MDAEVWRPIPDTDMLYFASTLGRIKRIFGTREKVIVGHLDKRGYRHHHISVHGRKIMLFAHAMIASAFLGERPGHLQVDHVNGKKTDNRPANLEYVTNSENMRRATVLGLRASGKRNGTYTKPESRRRGSLNGLAKLREAEVLKIRSKYSLGMTQMQLAAGYGVSQASVSRIVLRQTWAHI